jgi:alpha-L-rhamnosidase
MKFIAIIPMLILWFFPQDSFAKKSQPQGLSVENLINPIGIDAPSPRFKWKLIDTRQGTQQTAYRIWMGTDSGSVARKKADLWDTGIVQGSQMLVVPGVSVQLSPFTRYYWTVQVWDQKGRKSRIARVASFETSMMEMKNWQGSWISDSNDMDFKPAPYFRKVTKPTGKIKTARAYITAAGLFELSINGARVGNHRLDPMYTRFDKQGALPST